MAHSLPIKFGRRRHMTNNALIENNEYSEFLKALKLRIRSARISASKTVNKEMISLYWEIGKDIVEKQEQLGWGKAVVERLSCDLIREFPGSTGFSPQNLWLMRQLFLEYRNDTILQQAVGELPWGQNVIIIQRVKTAEARTYYLKATAEMGWSRNVLLNQIKANAYERHRLTSKQHNFGRALPEHLAEQADKSMKDVYMLDFLGVSEPIVEREIERRMVAAIKDVLLELGYGFSFLGNQYRIKTENNEYFIDLLFYHRRLRCLVAVELKTGKFKPEFAGKMNFYLNLLDDYVKEKDENPSIGIILCADRDHFEVEYALRGIQKPIGIAEYNLMNELPKQLAGKLPDARQLRIEIMKELKK
jgi:predicted nuclease of restriction endonuclease-like (RecB) superfamily